MGYLSAMCDLISECDMGKMYTCHKDIVIRIIGDVFLLIPIRNIPSISLEQFIVTNNVGAVIWESCLNKESIDQIVMKISTLFIADRAVVQRDVFNVISTLCDLKLLFEVPYEL